MRLLLFSYYYPPLGGPGVQRPCRMVYYFRKNGWDVDVISVKDIVFHSYDRVMLKECRENSVHRVRSWDLMSLFHWLKRSRDFKEEKIYFQTQEKYKRIIRGLFPIDDKIGWLPFAYKQGVKLCSKTRYDAVMATIGPYSSAVVTYLVSKRCDIPLVIDYRDAWTLHPYVNFLSILHKKLAHNWELKILKWSRAISVNSKQLKKNLSVEFGDNLKPKIHVMYNAWDERDFPVKLPKKVKRNVIEFFYMGGFYGLQTPKYFISALDELISENSMPDNVIVTFVGNYFYEVTQLLKNCRAREIIDVVPQISHKKVIEKMLSADVLILFVATYKGKGVIPGKLFEYLRSQKEILAMIPPDGETAEILKYHGHTMICSVEDIEKLKANFIEIYNKVLTGREQSYKIDEFYSREHQTKEFMDFIQKRIN
ncbi:MAG: glycosyltransferase [Candidatus Celaenobacter antarcticus]|nr:glycosyltransferase [Candidatus Celaenobacter antarcticus]